VQLNPRDPIATPIVARIDELFAVDAEARRKALTTAARHVRRQETAKPLLDDVRSKIEAGQSVALPSSALSKACQYALTLWRFCRSRHTSPEMTMRYLDVALTDLQREFQRARSQPRHLVPQPKMPSARLRAGIEGVIDSLLAAQHVLEMFRRALPKSSSRACLDRLSNRLTKILSGARKLRTP
jgi:hypothetical protein